MSARTGGVDDPVGRGGVHLYGGRGLEAPEVLQHARGDGLQLLGPVHVLHARRGAQVQLVVGRVVLVEVVVWDVVGDGRAQQDTVQHSQALHTGTCIWRAACRVAPRLVRPAAGNVAHGVAPSAQHEQRQVEGPHVLHAGRVSQQREVEAAESVAR